MRIEFKGASVVVEGFQGAFTLTVGGESLTFAPKVEVSERVSNEPTYAYRIRFHAPWGNAGATNKIMAIKCIREHLRTGLMEAKNISEGREDAYIVGPSWMSSDFRRALSACVSETHFDVYAIEKDSFSSVVKIEYK